MTNRFHRQTFIPVPAKTIFSFFEQPINLKTITPAWMGFELLAPLPDKFQTNVTLAYSVSPFGFKTRWQSTISVWNFPYEFKDEHRWKSRLMWSHTHRLYETTGGTRMEDEIEICLPSLLSMILALPLQIALKFVFQFRAKQLQAIFSHP